MIGKGEWGMNTKNNKGFRIYSWARFITFMVILILLAFLAGGFVFKSTVSGMEDTQYETVVVMAGDTLWDIADEYTDSTDVRNLIQEICNVNKISSGELFPGQTLQIPVS